MLFALGVIIGILVSVLIVVTVAYFKKPIEHFTKVIEKQIEIHGPRPKGFLIEPDSEADVERQKLIERNNALGKDTKLSELQ
jgi:hypothetical protein